MNNLITAAEVSERTGIAVNTLNKWRTTGECDLPYLKLRGRIMYSVDDLQAWLRKHTVRNKED